MARPSVPNDVLTREALADLSLLAELRRHAPPEVSFLDAEALEASLERALVAHPGGADVHLFGYGSLMWNPAIHFSASMPGLVRGWHRRFCLQSTVGRGSPQQPGLMLGLLSGGACRGLVFRIAAGQARDELRLVWRREMSTGVYRAHWLDVATDGGPIRALTFVVNRAHPRYVGGLSIEETVRLVRSGRGRLGTCEAYADALFDQLAAMSVVDAGMERLRRALRASGARAA